MKFMLQGEAQILIFLTGDAEAQHWSGGTCLFQLSGEANSSVANATVREKAKKKKNRCAREAHNDSSDHIYQEERRDETC